MEIEFEYSEELIRKATLRYLAHSQGKLILIYLAAGIVLLFFKQWWLAAFFISILLLMLTFAVIGIIHNPKKTLDKAEHRRVRFCFGEEGVQMTTDLDSGAVKWQHFHRLQRFEDMWLLFLNRMMFYVLPIEQLTPELKVFIVDKLSEHQIRLK